MNYSELDKNSKRTEARRLWYLQKSEEKRRSNRGRIQDDQQLDNSTKLNETQSNNIPFDIHSLSPEEIKVLNQKRYEDIAKRLSIQERLIETKQQIQHEKEETQRKKIKIQQEEKTLYNLIETLQTKNNKILKKTRNVLQSIESQYDASLRRYKDATQDKIIINTKNTCQRLAIHQATTIDKIQTQYSTLPIATLTPEILLPIAQQLHTQALKLHHQFADNLRDPLKGIHTCQEILQQSYQDYINAQYSPSAFASHVQATAEFSSAILYEWASQTGHTTPLSSLIATSIRNHIQTMNTTKPFPNKVKRKHSSLSVPHG